MSQTIIAAFIAQLGQSPLVTCTPTETMNRVSLHFSLPPPTEPGVYAVCCIKSDAVFYVGEASDLKARLKFLFRCNGVNNPHPCHLRHREVTGAMPDCALFCQTYRVRWISTKCLSGRLEIEEALQDALGTNVRKFYEKWQISGAAAVPVQSLADQSADELSPCCEGEINRCDVLWTELSTSPRFLNPEGLLIPTMGGRAANLCVYYDLQTQLVRVWRPDGTPDFRMSKDQFQIICSRYMTGLLEGNLPAPTENGGTGFFTLPIWPEPVLGMYNTPYAAAVLRSILNRVA